MKNWANLAGLLVLAGIAGFAAWRYFGNHGPPACDAAIIVPVIKAAAEADTMIRQAALTMEKLDEAKETAFDEKSGRRSCAGILVFSGGVRWPGVWTLTQTPGEMRSASIEVRLKPAPLAPAK